MRHFPFRELGCAIGFLALLAALYVGAYYATVERAIAEHYAYVTPWFFVRYRLGGDMAVMFFAPIHDLDRRLRSEYWERELFIVNQ